MREETSGTDSETYEHIPWSRLTLTNDPTHRGRWMYVAAGLLIVAAIGAVVARLVWQPEVAAAPSSTSPPPPANQVPATAITAAMLSEADLMAASPPRGVEQTVAASAERFVRQWLGGAGERWAYVEWTVVESVEDLGQGRFRVHLLMQLLSGAEDETVRLPVEAVVLTIRLEGDEVSVVDLPVPIPAARLSVDRPVIAATDPPPAVVTGALGAVAPWGEGTVVSSGLVGDRWRVEVSVKSPDGLVRTVAVWLTSDGERTDPA